MAQTIRTRKTHRDIKALDKTMTAAERMKNTYVRAKDSVDRHGAGRNRAAPWNMQRTGRYGGQNRPPMKAYTR